MISRNIKNNIQE